MSDLKACRKHLAEQNRNYTDALAEVPRSDWPPACAASSVKVVKVFRSRHFLVTVYQESEELHRLSVCRTRIRSDFHFEDGLSWDELQACKDGCGYAENDAVEVYPAKRDIVNVANMRHLWVSLSCKLPFAWRDRKPASVTS